MGIEPKYHLSEEHRLKISAALKGKIKTPEHEAAIRTSLSSPSVKSKQRAARLGKVASESTRAKLRILKAGNMNMLGKHHSEETKRKMSIAQTGKRRSERTRALVGASSIGKVYSEEYLQKQKESHLGQCWKSSTYEKMSGENHPNWKGGISFGKYCPKFNTEFKERVRNFFGRICVECGLTEEENTRKLDVHHVNYDKMVCCNDVRPLFVALCRNHNAMANANREYWEQHYTQIINEKYNGECYLRTRSEIMYQ